LKDSCIYGYHNYQCIWLILGHNREDFWEIPESILGKFLSIIDTGLQNMTVNGLEAIRIDWQ